jgi:hypothetical protein
LLHICWMEYFRYSLFRGSWLRWYWLTTIKSAIIYFLVMYTYITTTARQDGWGVGLY